MARWYATALLGREASGVSLVREQLRAVRRQSAAHLRHRSVRRWLNQTVGSTFAAWHQQLICARLVERGRVRLVHCLSARGLRTWREQVTAAVRARRLVASAVYKLRHRYTAQTLDHWAGATHEAQRASARWVRGVRWERVRRLRQTWLIWRHGREKTHTNVAQALILDMWQGKAMGTDAGKDGSDDAGALSPTSQKLLRQLQERQTQTSFDFEQPCRPSDADTENQEKETDARLAGKFGAAFEAAEVAMAAKATAQRARLAELEAQLRSVPDAAAGSGAAARVGSSNECVALDRSLDEIKLEVLRSEHAILVEQLQKHRNAAASAGSSRKPRVPGRTTVKVEQPPGPSVVDGSSLPYIRFDEQHRSEVAALSAALQETAVRLGAIDRLDPSALRVQQQDRDTRMVTGSGDTGSNPFGFDPLEPWP